MLRLQRLAGNRAVASAVTSTVAVQRHLKATGAAKDIGEMIGLLGPASALKLAYDGKSKLVSGTPSDKKPVSPSLAGRLQTIIDDPKRDAEVNLGRTQAQVSFGAFPTTSEELANNPVQDLRIDHFAALEKGVPGSGVVKLAHEIIENYEGHSHKDDLWSVAFGQSHDEALKAELSVQDELQASRGEKRSGARRNSFKFVVGTGKTQKLRWIEAHENDFLLWDQSFGDEKNTLSNARRVGKASVGTYRVDGIPNTTALPKSADATLQTVVDVLTKDRTASVVLQPSAGKGTPLADAPRLSELVQEAISDRAPNVEIGAWDRFFFAPGKAGASNSVTITVERPAI